MTDLEKIEKAMQLIDEVGSKHALINRPLSECCLKAYEKLISVHFHLVYEEDKKGGQL